MQVVMRVVRRPPDRTFLKGTGAKKRKHALKRARRFETSVSKIPMVACYNAKHPR
jgi:hypothetical protein